MNLGDLVNLGKSADAEFTASDDVPSAGAEGGLWCESGGHLWAFEGRGRKPKDCPEHRPRAGSTRASAGGGTSERKLTKLKEDLASQFAKLGKGMASAMPVAGTVTVMRSANTADAMVELCKNNPKALKALYAAAQAVPALDLGEYVGMMVIAVQVDTGRMAPDHRAAELFGVTEVYEKLYGSMPASVAERPLRTAEPPTFHPVSV